MTEHLDTDDMWDALDSLDNQDGENIPNPKECPGCKNSNVVCDYSKGFMRCDNCGTCFGKVYDDRAEWSTYEDSTTDSMARCSHATSFFFPKSSMRTPVTGNKNSMIGRMRMWDLMPYDEYSLFLSFNEIKEVCLRNLLPDAVVDNVKIIYKKIHDKHIIIRGKKRSSMYGACTFYGCQIQNYYRTPGEIAKMYNIKSSDVTDACSRLRKILINDRLLNSLPPVSPVDFMARYCYQLNLNKQQIADVMTITKNNIKLFLTSNHQPMSIAAACVLIYLHIYKLEIPTKQQVLKVFDITMVTTDKIFAKMLPFRNVLIDNAVTDMILKKLIASKYIAVDASLQTDLDNRVTEIRNETYNQEKKWLKS